MRCRLFIVCSALSLLLFAAVCVAWVRSYRLTDQVAWRRTDGGRFIRSAHGQLVVALNLSDWSHQPAAWYGLSYERTETSAAANDLIQVMVLNVGPNDTWISWSRGRFAWIEWRSQDGASRIARGVAPFWSLAAMTAVLPLAWVAGRAGSHIRRRRREAMRLCRACGYDVRASPGRCPECGAAVRGAAE